MELNAEQIKKALREMARWGIYASPNAIENALSLITSQEQRIKELETENKQFRDEQRKLIEERDAYKMWAYNKNALINAMTDKIEIGYEPYGAKAVAEAEMWKRIALREMELTEKVASWKEIAEGYQKQFEDCAEDRAKLTEENERLHASCTELTQNLHECKADTIHKMLDQISEHATNGHPRKVRLDVVEKIAKEMLEEG